MVSRPLLLGSLLGGILRLVVRGVSRGVGCMLLLAVLVCGPCALVTAVVFALRQN